jgi:ribosomal-protein-alanine N-acetyltransferase
MPGAHMFKNLETKRLLLRGIDHSDRDFILQEFQDDFVNRFLFDAEPMTDISQADELIDFYNMLEPRKQNRWVLIDRATNTRLGTCGFHVWDPDNKEVEIGFELMEQYNGKGYMREAVEAIVEFARREMQVQRINAIVSIENGNCIRLLERLGFVKVGQQETVFRGQTHLHHIYALKTSDN